MPDRYRHDPSAAGRQQPEEQRYDRFTPTQAMSRRGYVLWALVPFVLAAIGFTAVSVIAHEKGSSGLALRLPISGGAADTGSVGDRQLAGQIETDAQHCVYLQPSSGTGPHVWAVWPIGYTATLSGTRVAMNDRHGNQVAQTGQLVTIRGAYTSAKDYATEPCLPRTGQVFVIDSPVTAVGQ